MPNTIYWAALLSEKSSNLLKATFKPEHPKIFAEHVTLAFGPTEEQDEKWFKRLGEIVELKVKGEAKDKRGHAVLVEGIQRDDDEVPHVTISCAKGTKPMYSNYLLSKGSHVVQEMILEATIARYTKDGWETKKKIQD